MVFIISFFENKSAELCAMRTASAGSLSLYKMSMAALLAG
uniref:Uncharacterized protein n=1 Tax=Arundo donax TaxID=35708 RepID=A0A0A9DSD9_ARUDO